MTRPDNDDLKRLAEGAKGPEGDAVEPIERAIKALKRDIAAIQDAKKRGGSGASLTDCINRLPEIVRWLESGIFNVEAAFEQYEDAANLRTQAPDSWRPISEHDNSADEVLVMRDGWRKPVVAWRHHPSSRTDMWLTVPGKYQVRPTEFHPLPALRPQTAESGK